MSDERDDMFGRWSRRKTAVAQEAQEAAAAAQQDETVEVKPEVEETEEEALARLGLPDPDALGEGDDFAAFMKAGVPDIIRRRALRRLWTTNPVLANVDGLVEYGENYASPDLIPEVVATAYKVGRGFLKDIVDEAPEKDVGDDAQHGSDDGPIARESIASEAPADAEDTARPSLAAGELSHPADPLSDPQDIHEGSADTENSFRPRRMQFRVNT